MSDVVLLNEIVVVGEIYLAIYRPLVEPGEWRILRFENHSLVNLESLQSSLILEC